jgi:hypothetical protein
VVDIVIILLFIIGSCRVRMIVKELPILITWYIICFNRYLRFLFSCIIINNNNNNNNNNNVEYTYFSCNKTEQKNKLIKVLKKQKSTKYIEY